MIELILGDSMRIIPCLRQQFDMIFLDPTFFDWQTDKPGDKKPDHNLLSAYITYVLKPNGCIFLCGTIPQLAEDWFFWKRFFSINFELIINKHAGTPAISSKRPIPIHENIWCLYRTKDNFKELKIDIKRLTGKGEKVTMPKVKRRMRTRYGKEWHTWYRKVGYPKSVFDCSRIDAQAKEYEGHPAQKPLNLMKLLISISTDKGDWILDPFAGSGTTLVMAKRMGRNCIGVEIDKEYAGIIRRRLQREVQIKKLQDFTQSM